VIAVLTLMLLAGGEERPSGAEVLREAVFGLPGVWQAAAPKPLSAVRTKRSADDFKALRENNIFSPPRSQPKEGHKTDPAKEGPKTDAPKSRMASVTGFVFNEQEKRYEALVEDREWNDKDKKYVVREIRFLRPGDAFAGGTVEEITVDFMKHKVGEKVAELRTGDQVPLEGSATLGGAAPGGTAKDDSGVDQKTRDEARERLKNKFRKTTVPDEAEDEGVTKKRR